MSVIHIRDFQSDDLERVADLWHASWLSTGLATAPDVRAEEYRNRLATEGQRDWCIKLACSGAGIVGFVAFNRPVTWLRQIFVAPHAQRSGIGTLLLDVAKREMPNGFWLRAQFNNEPAKRFYERQGLRPDGVVPHETHGGLTARYRWP